MSRPDEYLLSPVEPTRSPRLAISGGTAIVGTYYLS